MLLLLFIIFIYSLNISFILSISLLVNESNLLNSSLSFIHDKYRYSEAFVIIFLNKE